MMNMVPPTSLRESAIATVAGWIVGGRFRPGDTLPIESDLETELGVSRTVVREALRSLVAKGLVLTGPRVGTRVRPYAEWNLFDADVIAWRLDAGVDAAFVRDLLELRLAIEPTAARLAAGAADPADVAAIEDAYRRMGYSVEGRGNYLSSDLAFHTAILKAAHNQFITGLVPVFTGYLRVSFRLSVKNRTRARASLPAHLRLLRAIAAHKPAVAERAAIALIETARGDIEADIASDEHFLVEGIA